MKIKPATRYNFTSIKLVHILNQTISSVDEDVEQQDFSHSLLKREEIGANMLQRTVVKSRKLSLCMHKETCIIMCAREKAQKQVKCPITVD